MERFFGIIMKKIITVFLLSLSYFSSNKSALSVFFSGWFLFFMERRYCLGFGLVWLVGGFLFSCCLVFFSYF